MSPQFHAAQLALARWLTLAPVPLSLAVFAWRSYLRTHHIDVVAAGPFPSRGPDRELMQWLESEPSPLTRIYGNPTEEPSLYRLREAGRDGGESRPSP